MNIRNGVADKIKPSHMKGIFYTIRRLNGQRRCSYFAKDGLKFDVTLTAYGDIIVSIKHCL